MKAGFERMFVIGRGELFKTWWIKDKAEDLAVIYAEDHKGIVRVGEKNVLCSYDLVVLK